MSVMQRRLLHLGVRAAKESDKALRDLLRLALHWDNDFGAIVDAHFKLPKPSFKWKELPKWQRRWNREAKRIVGF